MYVGAKFAMGLEEHTQTGLHEEVVQDFVLRALEELGPFGFDQDLVRFRGPQEPRRRGPPLFGL